MIGERIAKTPIKVKTNQNPRGRKGWKGIMGRKRVVLDKNLLQLFMMFLIITMDTLIINTNPILTIKTRRTGCG